MLVQSSTSWSGRCGATLLVVTVHLLFISVLFAKRTTHAMAEGDAIEVRFFAETRASQPAVQPPIPPIATLPTPQLLVPTPEVAVAATTPVAIPVMVSAEPQTTATSVNNDPTAPTSPPVISDPEFVKVTAPAYPLASRRLKEQGTVVLRVMVDEIGRAAQVNVHRSSGFARLDAVACETVRSWLFKPYVREGQAQAALVYVPVEFSLKGHVPDEKYGRRKARASAPIASSSGT